MKRLIPVLFVILFSCKKENPDPPDITPDPNLFCWTCTETISGGSLSYDKCGFTETQIRDYEKNGKHLNPSPDAVVTCVKKP